jgi:pimeloyl-ACP methyl ester carboxylesterase
VSSERPASLVLVHGAGSGPWVFDDWRHDFPNFDVVAVDLQAQLDPAEADMGDYAEWVAWVAAAQQRPLVLCGWSLGGLAALIAAQVVLPQRLVLLEPSPPQQVQGYDEDIPDERGVFDPEEVYGAFPPGMRARPESRRARADRKRGMSVPSIPCPALVGYGDEFRDERGTAVARVYDCEERYFPGFTHWDLVLRAEVRTAIAEWLRA